MDLNAIAEQREREALWDRVIAAYATDNMESGVNYDDVRHLLHMGGSEGEIRTQLEETLSRNFEFVIDSENSLGTIEEGAWTLTRPTRWRS